MKSYVSILTLIADLKPDKTEEIQKQLMAILDLLPSLHKDYCNKLTEIAESL